MRYLGLLVSLLLIGCVQTSLPVASTEDAWQAFGTERALNGSLKLSEASLGKMTNGSMLDEKLYAAYSQGYEVGRAEYCTQNAYILGVKGQQYLGICDQISIWFREDYNAGRHSMAGGIF